MLQVFKKLKLQNIHHNNKNDLTNIQKYLKAIPASLAKVPYVCNDFF